MKFLRIFLMNIKKVELLIQIFFVINILKNLIYSIIIGLRWQ